MNNSRDCKCERPHCVCIVSVSTQDKGELKVDMDFTDETRMRIDDIERSENRIIVHSLLLHCSVKEAIEKCVNDENENGKRVSSLNKKVNSLPIPFRNSGERSYHLTYDSKNTSMDTVMKIFSMIEEFFQHEISMAVSKTMVFTCCQSQSDNMVRKAANEVIEEQYLIDLK